MGIILYLGMIIFQWILFGPNALAIPNCPGGHCANVSTPMNRYCIDMGLAGKPFLVIGPDGSECFCPCSCVASTTQVLLDSGKWTDFTNLHVGDKVDTPMRSTSSQVERRLASQVNNYPAYLMRFANGKEMIVSHNHLFVTPDFRAIPAERLQADSNVLLATGQPVALTEVYPNTSYDGSMENLIIHSSSCEPSDHLFNTEGILSGDFLLQSHAATIAQAVDLRMSAISDLSSLGVEQ